MSPPGSDDVTARELALFAALERLGGERFDRDLIIEAIVRALEDDRALRARVLDRAKDLLDHSQEFSLGDLLRP